MKKLLAILLCALMGTTMLACFGGGGGPNGPTGDAVTVTFRGYGEEDEIAIFRNLVNKFNAEHEGEIWVDYDTTPGGSYYESMAQILSGNKTPDVVYMGDDVAKEWAINDYITPLDEYVASSEIIKLDEMWDSGIQRYRYDVETGRSDPDSTLWALPKDIGPTVLYYNVTQFEAVGIDIVSVDKEDVTAEFVDAYNTEHGTSYTVENMKRGFWRPNIDDYAYLYYDQWVQTAKPTKTTPMLFNNRIPMTWAESEDLFKILTKSYNDAAPSTYGYFTEWWFNYGWSVGGDCIKYDESKGQYVFSLGDTTKVYNNNGVLTTEQVAGATELPTMLEAFTKFVQLSQPVTRDIDGKGTKGLAITPSPNTLNQYGKEQYFTNGLVATMVDGRWAVPVYRKTRGLNFDCAPLPVAPGGIEAGHCGSVGFVIPKRSRRKAEAFKFIEFMAGPEGQAEQAKSGFNIPNQKALSTQELFLQPDKMPKNSIVFVRAAEVQRAGDWNYLADGLWIDQWADYLNDEVRNGKNNLTDFWNEVTDRTNLILKGYRYTNFKD